MVSWSLVVVLLLHTMAAGHWRNADSNNIGQAAFKQESA